MEKESALAFEYLNAIPHKTWATYAFPYPRFGHLTSNLSESINSAWKDLRHFPILKMVDTIWSTMMKTIYKRYHEPQKNNILCNIPYAMFQERLKVSQQYQVSGSRTGRYQVQVPDINISISLI